MKSINEITALDDERDISDFSNSSNDDFQKFLPTNIRRCCQYLHILCNTKCCSKRLTNDDYVHSAFANLKINCSLVLAKFK